MRTNETSNHHRWHPIRLSPVTLVSEVQMKIYDSYQDVPEGAMCRPLACRGWCFRKKGEWLCDIDAIADTRQILGKWEVQSPAITITEEEALAKSESILSSDVNGNFLAGAHWAIGVLFK